MDETGRKNDPYGLPHIGNELNEQMRQAAERAQSPIEEQWSPEEEAQLQSELARITFNPAFSNPDFIDRTVKINGEDLPIHEYNSFPMKLSLINKIRTSTEPPELNTYEATYAAYADERKYNKIADVMQRRFPALFKRSIQLFEAARTEKEAPGRKVTEDEARFIFSQAYSAAAQIAREIDPYYDLAYLYA